MAGLLLVLLITLGLCHLVLVPLLHIGTWVLDAGWLPWLLRPAGLWLVAGRPADR
jgi:hypothetical protein